LQSLTAHEAVAARDVERDDDTVAGFDVCDCGADLLDEAHRLVAQDVPGVEMRIHDLVQVEV
jgi:hypothetical protein